MATVSRAALLRGSFFRDRSPIRPPWAATEAVFAARCTACGDCLPACPEGILRRGRGGLPEVDFDGGACSFCGTCATACPSGALVRPDVGTRPWQLEASIGAACLNHGGVLCRTCEEACASRAIRFRLRPGGRSAPVIDSETCTGCGACVAPCPTAAISLQDGAPS